MQRTWITAAVAIALAGSPAWAGDDYPESIPVPPGSPRPVYRQLELAGRDATKLILHEWAPVKAPAGNPVVLFIPGIGMHGEPHAAVAAGFTLRQVTFAALDLRGHGRSDGKRGALAEPHVLRADIGAALAVIKERHPQAPIVLAGDSLGALFAADYAWRGEHRLAGLALLVPAFAVHPKQVQLAEIGPALLGGVRIDSDQKLKASTREPGFIKARQADKLALSTVKLPFLATVAGMQREWPRAAAELKLPLFIGIAGQDQIVDAKASKEVYDRAGTPKEARVWRQWDEAWHTVCWDPLTPQIFDEVATWVLRMASDVPTKKER